MKEILVAGKLSEHIFLNFIIRFLYYTMLGLLVLSIIWAIQARGKAQGVFVLIPLTLFEFIALPLVLIILVYIHAKKTEVSELFKRVSNRLMWVPLAAFIILLGVVS